MSRELRKAEHIRLALSTEEQIFGNGLNDIQFVHNCIPNINLDEIRLNTIIGELVLSSPIILNAMTGGSKESEKINQSLAIVSRELDFPMAVGSQMAAVMDPSLASSYSIVRKENPNGILFANLGSEATIEQAKVAVEMIEANAIQIHLNAVQELVMPEGDKNFKGMIERLRRIIEEMPIPVIVKEVGFGMAREEILLLSQIGADAVDIGGFGGTNFAQIENKRRNENPFPLFNQWGIHTAESLLEGRGCHVQLIASGGIYHGLDVAKAIALGADAVGIARPFLKSVYESGIEEAIKKGKSILDELRLVMAALGISNIQELKRTPLVIMGKTAEWAKLRGVDIASFARRKRER
ncbi:type 2 isopentenyl-diphosphate Delta-isomerase [Microaerobacter geothermalis]|uniref:type 2 isopentenyl-diphosphate Delta-isomerase n=1 Tax=Microaerobacter geothermalis TaxID=674972 RepID=UPI001F347479|nr:type 2 isopentenyl-diphosphate Delta-isomerase [Microaerobacter geothermalis]MCF6093523.1 type 2 isopentenyl-diphosphate Delta-isomerase [Microaerobacter geothermalis]